MLSPLDSPPSKFLFSVVTIAPSKFQFPKDMEYAERSFDSLVFLFFKGACQNKGARKCQKIENIVRGKNHRAPLESDKRRMPSGKLIQEGCGDSFPAVYSQFFGIFVLLYFVKLAKFYVSDF